MNTELYPSWGDLDMKRTVEDQASMLIKESQRLSSEAAKLLAADNHDDMMVIYKNECVYPTVIKIGERVCTIYGDTGVVSGLDKDSKVIFFIDGNGMEHACTEDICC